MFLHLRFGHIRAYSLARATGGPLCDETNHLDGRNNKVRSIEGKRILLVDDEPEVLNVFQSIFESVGGILSVAKNGAQALQIYRNGIFDCVVTDYSMPLLTGDALALAVKTENPAQRVVMVSGYAVDLVQGGKLPWYLDALLPKPPDLAALLNSVAPD